MSSNPGQRINVGNPNNDDADMKLQYGRRAGPFHINTNIIGRENGKGMLNMQQEPSPLSVTRRSPSFSRTISSTSSAASNGHNSLLYNINNMESDLNGSDDHSSSSDFESTDHSISCHKNKYYPTPSIPNIPSLETLTPSCSMDSSLKSNFKSNLNDMEEDTTSINSVEESKDNHLKQSSEKCYNPNRHIDSHISCLYSGAVYEGEQRSGKCSYKVKVELQRVDLSDSFLCGYLHIEGLTEDYPKLCTFFEAEIIGNKHKFLTRKWEADDEIDLQHWSRFPSFSPYIDDFHDENLTINPLSSNYIFMRWKEHFLVPNHLITNISGASFAGFYYVCLQKSTGVISGLYFHKRSDWFQYLTLKHVPQSQCSAEFEFR